MITEEALQKRVEESPALRELRDQLTSDMSDKLGGESQVAIVIIIAMISLAIQIMTYCKNKPKDEVRRDVRNIRALRPRQLMRLKRRANKLWREYCEERGLPTDGPNPVLASLYDIAEKGSDAALNELLDIALD